MTLKELIEHQYPIMEEIPYAFLTYYVESHNDKQRVQKASILRDSADECISKVEGRENFIRWLDSEELKDVFYRFAKLMVGR